jgi:hypothetical protein
MSVAAHALRRGVGLFDDPGYEPASDKGRSVQSLWTEGQHILGGSANDWRPVIAPMLVRIRTECAAPGWDGDGSQAVSPRTLLRAARVVEFLANLVPIGTPPPDVVPESDGEISFSWHADSNRVYALSIGAHDKVNFAGQFGEQGSTHGWQPLRFDSRGVDQETLAEIARQIVRLSAGASG